MDEYEKQVNDQKSEAGRRQLGQRIAIKALAQHKDGRDFLWWLLEQGNTFGVAFAVGPDGRHDAGASAFMAGKQAYGCLVRDEIIATDPNIFLDLVKENRRVRTRESGTDSSGTEDGASES